MSVDNNLPASDGSSPLRGPRESPLRFVVGITGASGTVYGVRVLEALESAGAQTHLVLTECAVTTMRIESGYTPEQVRALATVSHDVNDFTAPIASGSFHHDGMVVAPCSIKTLSALANAYADNLLLRAGDVTLKERRRLVLLVRETPLSSIHLELMLRLSNAGAVIMPPVPAFYQKPASIDDMVDHTVGRVLSLLGVRNDLAPQWGTR
jgi:4-hydroxy-3-polyprenylbenzoate decarboxylase